MNSKREINGRGNATFLKNFVVLFLIMPAICQATTITIGFAGVVDDVDDPCNLLGGGLQQNTSISGSYIYDSETPGLIEGTTTARAYWHSVAPYGITLEIGNLTFQTDSANVKFLINIGDNLESGGGDRYLIQSYNNLNINNDVIVDTFFWQLDDYSGNAISSTDLPDSPPDLTAWQSGNNLHISGGRGGIPPCFDELFRINGHITDVWIVPEPTTLLLFSLSALLLRKRAKNIS
jgi:hypothetical protein